MQRKDRQSILALPERSKVAFVSEVLTWHGIISRARVLMLSQAIVQYDSLVLVCFVFNRLHSGSDYEYFLLNPVQHRECIETNLNQAQTESQLRASRDLEESSMVRFSRSPGAIRKFIGRERKMNFKRAVPIIASKSDFKRTV